MGDVTIGVDTLFFVGPFAISTSLGTSLLLTAVVSLAAWLMVRRMGGKPTRRQAVTEAIVSGLEDAVRQVAGVHAERIMPFISTLWVFLICGNLLGLVPGMDSPTRDLSVTAALAVTVFLSVHWFGITTQGWGNYFRHYLSPNPIMLPFHIISEITRTVALAVRLFGNMMSLELAAFLVLMVAGFLVPIPILMLHIVEALVQAYIFGMLALIYVVGGIQSHEERSNSSR
ncbi:MULTISPECIES: F0F1 ATP synthase subunit A [Desulfosediminicola]|uniref:F0F1 ATP synthase subunit A n=1 Tax=Desulfosediminicola TaxID=2886823 RepID=UPI0010AB805E|nr:F0F1 ATP synthase subunit A [Desulfosediminicola ganghwensis]